MSPVLARPSRVAMFSLHTSPMDLPGSGSSGGMNVEIREMAQRLADRGVEVDVFTRCAGRDVAQVESTRSGLRVVQVPAGPCAEVPTAALPPLLPRFNESISALEAELGPYDLVHAHYWLSGPPAMTAARRWDVPLVASFHTLAEVKNRAIPDGDVLEPLVRVAGERRVVRASDRIVVPTPEDAVHLADLYGADPGRVRVVPPGVDAAAFRPREVERAWPGGGPVVLFVGRLQMLKGPDLAIRAFARAVSKDPDTMRGAVLLVVGGPSGPSGETVNDRLRDVVREEGVEHSVIFLPPRPHEEMPFLYSGADVLLMPSRSESFGLAALEAQACGLPVVASDVGGLRHAVADGVSGLLAPAGDAEAHSRALLSILGSAALASRMSAAAREHAAGFSWELGADRLLDVYGELLAERESAQAS